MKVFICLLAISFASISYTQVDGAASVDAVADVEIQPFAEYIPFQKDKRWYLYDITNARLDTTRWFERLVLSDRIVEYYIFEKDNRMGAIDAYGDTLLPFDYDSIVAVPYGVAGKLGTHWDFRAQYWDQSSEINSYEIDSFYCLNGITYTYRNGKMGAMRLSKEVLTPKYGGIQALNQTEEFVRQYDVLLASEGANFRFFDLEGTDLLGVATSKYQILDHHFLKYWDGTWKYYNFRTEEHLDFGNNPIVFYSEASYKVYNQARTQSVYYENGRIVGSGFEDYFPIGEDFVAVRQSGKIGVIHKNGSLVVSPKYDKVECLSYRSSYFKFFVGDACGLLSPTGEELSKPLYANIVETPKDDRFIVLDHEQTGIIDGHGKEICPLEYTHIESHDACFTIQKKKRIGLMNWDGKVILQPMYSAYSIFEDDDGMNERVQTFVFKSPNGKFILANKSNRLTDLPFDEFNYGNNTFKLYRSSEIEVVVLNKNGDVEDRMKYQNIGSLVIESEFKRAMNGTEAWEASYLEENQLSGKFGLRWFQKQGIAVEPVYDYVQQGRLSSYFGEREVSDQTIELFPDVAVRLNHVYDQMYLPMGKVINSNLVMAESVLHWSPALSTSEALVCGADLDLWVELEHADSPFSPAEKPLKINYGEHLRSQDLKMITLESQPELCDLKDAEVSLLEYYQYFNVLGGMELTAEAAKSILNPQLGVRFVGGKTRVHEIGLRSPFANFVSFRPYKDVLEINFLAENDLMRVKELDNQEVWNVKEYTWPKDDKPLPTLECADFRDEQATQGRFYEAFKKVNQKALVHVDFPEFQFFPIDSISMKYSAGRLITGEAGSVQLSDPSSKVYVDRAKQIDYLGNDLFRVQYDSLWHVIDRDNKPWKLDSFDLVLKHSNEIIQVFQGNKSFLFKWNGALVASGDRGLQWVTEQKYRISNSPEVWFDAATQQRQTLDLDAEYLGNNVFLKKSPNGSYVCSFFGQSDLIEFESDSKPRMLGKFLTYEMKKNRFILSSDGEITKWKNASMPKKHGTCFTMEGKKKTVVLNEKGSWIADAPYNAEFSPADGGVLVSTSDTNYVILENGTQVAWSEFKKIKADQQTESDVATVVYENGKAGVKQNDQFTIPPVYDNLLLFEGKTFVTYISNGWRVCNDDLKEFESIPYEAIYQLPNFGWLLLTNGRYFLYNFDGASLN